jgi:uncharacterized protein (UPF0276 family)
VAFAVPSALGVGCSLPPSRPGILEHIDDLVDFVEIGPDTLSRELGGDSGRMAMGFVPELLDAFLEATHSTTVVVHGVELSIGTAGGWNEGYLDLLDRFAARRSFPWHSEHLGFLFSRDGNRIRHAGVPLPLPFTREAVDLVAPRIHTITSRFGVPFLVENAAFYLPDLPADPGWDEAVFVTEVVERGDCGLLLDLFNLWVNACNHEFDFGPTLERLPLERVIEIHVAGGDEVDGFLLDSHSAAVPEPVWEAVEWVVPRAPNLAGIVFEVLETHLDRLGIAGLRDQLARARTSWAHLRNRTGS